MRSSPNTTFPATLNRLRDKSMRAGIFAAFLILLGAALLLLIFGPITYVRESREFRPSPIAGTGPDVIRLSELQPGLPLPPQSPNTGGENPSWYERNAAALSEGQRLFSAFNCVGCHAHGGGGIGPPLIDETWIYGSDIRNIFATISEGRPNGMPSFRGKIPPEQIWQIAAYVRSMAGLTPKQASPSRPDHLQAKASESSTPPQPPSGGTIPPAATAPQ
jgi:cytochrome c oxidase cbb3-type subunit III